MLSSIRATDLDDWVKKEPRRAQEILPLLIIKLILSTSSQIETFNFPIEKGIQFAGYDGFLVAGEQTAFFPSGLSVWEFGTDANTMGKFNDDIQKRHETPLGVNIEETSFVFATLKIWNHKTSIVELINDSKTKYHWKDIRIIDASTISMWLAQSLPVATWMAEIMGLHPSGLISLEQYWEDHCFTTTPNLTKEFFMVGRESVSTQLTNWLENSRGYRVVKADSTLEAILFTIAAIFALPENKKNAQLGQMVVVSTSEAWEGLIAQNDSAAILLPTFNFTEDIRCPQYVSALLPINRYSPFAKISRNVDAFEIPQMSKAHFHTALETLGYRASDFYKIEMSTKRCFLPFYRSITELPTQKRPRWSTEPNLQELIPAMMLGGWNADYDGDKKAIETLSGLKYENYINKLAKWLVIEDAPVFNVLSSYQIVSAQDMWSFLLEILTSEDIKKLEKFFINVFGLVDPTFELPEEQWMMGSVLGKKSSYSGLMRQGLIISLIMFAERTDFGNNCGVMSPEKFVYLTVKETLAPISTWQQWNTIANSLPMLTEASPQAVVEKLESEIKRADTELWRLFEATKDAFWGRNYYTQIIWSLEALVWYRSFAVRSVMLLAALCERNFEYKMVNSPANSLYEILCLWHPQICLNTQSRLKLLEKICNDYPLTGQKLLSSLLPTNGRICGYIHKPHWHTPEIEPSISITNQEYNDSINIVIRLCIEKLSNSAEGWQIIVKKIDLFEPLYVQVEDSLILSVKDMDDDDVLSICNALRERISSFRKFKDADWSITEEYADKLERMLIRVMPTTIGKYKYLFQWHPNLLHPTPHTNDGTHDYETDKKAVFALRADAVNNIIDQFGMDVLMDFCRGAEDTSDLAQIMTETIFNSTYEFSLLLRLKSVNYGLYSSVLWRLFSIHELDDMLQFLFSNNALTSQEAGDILCHTPLRKDVWDTISKLEEEIQTYYWQHLRVFRLDDMSGSSADYLISQLIKYGRPFSAIGAISYSDYSNTALIIQALETCLSLQNSSETNGMQITSLRSDDIVDLFQKIYNDYNRDIVEAAKLELHFLPYFKHHGTPSNLIHYLENHPEEYVMFLSEIYRSDNSDDKSITEEQQKSAHIAYDILDHFHKIPGCNSEQISEERFSNWVNKGYCCARETTCCKAFELGLGKLLSYSPKGADGIFPHEIIRKYLENNESRSLTNEFIIGKRNQRGVHYVTGGMEEKEIALSYYGDAEKIRIEYPKTAAILERLGDDYESESLYEQNSELMDFR